MSEIFPEPPITSLPEAVAFLGAPPMKVGPQQPPFPPAPGTFEEKLRQDVARLQGLLAEAVRDAHRARAERDLIRERVSEPFGCTHCGVEKRSHGRRYIGGSGMHAWERPSDEQVKARMSARRVARSPLPVAPELEQLHDDLTGANLSLWEEEQAYKWLRTAMLAVQRDRRNLRARVAELEAATDGCSCPPVDHPHQVGCPLDGVSQGVVPEESARLFPTVGRLREVPSGETDPGRRAAWRMLAQDVADGEHYPFAHHDYRVGHDLPETGGVQ